MTMCFRIFAMICGLALLSACSVKSGDEAQVPATGPDVGIEIPFGDAGGDASESGGSGTGDVDDDEGGGSISGGAASGGSSSGGSSSGGASGEEALKPLVIKTDKLKDGLQGEPYSQKLTAEGGSGQYEWIAVTGLPAAGGIQLEKRWIKGVAESAGAFPITIMVKDEESGETASKDFVLTVIKHLDEALRIVVEQSDDKGGWSEIDTSKEALELEKAARRIRLRVTKSDGGVPSAERYHWSVTSPEGRLAAFVPPSKIDVGGLPVTGTRGLDAYLIAWLRKGTGSLAIFDIEANKIDLSKTRVTVGDDYGNQASVVFDKIKIASASSAPGASGGGLSIKAPKEVRQKPYQSQPGDPKSLWNFSVEIQNGTPPYTLEVKKTRACGDLPVGSRTATNYDINNCERDANAQNPNWYWNCDASACWHFELELTRKASDGSRYEVTQDGGPNYLQQFNSSCAHVSYVDLIVRDAEGEEATKQVPLVINFHPTEDLEYCAQ